MTENQVILLNFIKKFTIKHGISPTMREISAYTGWGMKKIYANLNHLVKRRRIRWFRNSWRGIELEVTGNARRYLSEEAHASAPGPDFANGKRGKNKPDSVSDNVRAKN